MKNSELFAFGWFAIDLSQSLLDQLNGIRVKTNAKLFEEGIRFLSRFEETSAAVESKRVGQLDIPGQRLAEAALIFRIFEEMSIEKSDRSYLKTAREIKEGIAAGGENRFLEFARKDITKATLLLDFWQKLYNFALSKTQDAHDRSGIYSLAMEARI